MKKVLTAQDLGITDIPERGNISAWVDEPIGNDKTLPNYRCANCYDGTWYSSPTPYCPNCGAMMINYKDAYMIYKKALKTVNENT